MKKLMMVGMVIGAALVASAADWFNGGIGSDWPNDPSMNGGSWSNTTGSAYADSKVKVSADESTPLTFEATTNKTITSEKPTISANLGFTAFSSEANLPSVPSEAKAGVIVCGDYFYVVAKDPNGDTNIWTATTIAKSKSDTAEVAVTFLDSTTVEYAIGGSKTTNNVVAVTTVKRVRMSGDGSISSLTASSVTRGPTPGAGSEVSVDPVPGKDNTYEIKPTGESTEVLVDNVKSGDILIINGGDVDKLGLNSAVGVTIKVMNAANEIEITKAVKGLTDNNVFDATLDTNKTVDVKVDEDIVKVPVIPTLVEETEATKPFVVGSDVSTTVQSIPGLTYKLRRDEAPDGTYATTAASATAEENKATLTLTDDDKPADKAFYIIEVTK